MKKSVFIAMAMMAFGTSISSAQEYFLRGLEIYNPYYHNPAYIQAERRVQLDFIAYNYYWYSGMWAHAMTSIPALNSAAGLSFSRGWYDDVGEAWSLQLAYAYKHTFSEDLFLNAGVMFNSGHVDYEDGRFVLDQEYMNKRHSGTLGLGVAVGYKRLHAGLSARIPLYMTSELVHLGDGSTNTQKEDADNLGFRLISGYSFSLPWRLSLDPVFGLDYHVYLGDESQDLSGYLGANLKFRELAGIGFTVGNLVSVSTSLNIMDRVELIVGIYAGEHDLFSPIGGGSYTIGSGDFDVIAQIRVHL